MCNVEARDQPEDDHLQPGRPEVSVVIPTVRLDADFVAAVRSVQVQTLSEFEIVVVLDGIDDTEGVVPHDPRIRCVVLGSRSGTSAALNAGIAAASSDLIARLDADDLAVPDRLAQQVASFRSRPDLVLLGSAGTIIDAAGEERGPLDVPLGEVSSVLLRRNAFVHSSTMFTRWAFDAAGGYDPRCTRMQDYDLWLRMARLGPVVNAPDRLVRYRVHDGQHSRRTPAHGPAVSAVLESRRQLARHLGRRRIAQLVADRTWLAAQVVRASGLRRPRHLARVRRAVRDIRPAARQERDGVIVMTTIDVSLDHHMRGALADLRRSGFGPICLVSRDTGRLGAVAEREGVASVAVPMEREIMPVADLRALARLIALHARLRPALVVYGTPKAALLGAIASTVTRVPARVHVLHGLRLETVHGLRRRILLESERLTMLLSHSSIAVSASLRKRCAELGLPSSRPRVLGPGGFVGLDLRRHRSAARADRRRATRVAMGASPSLPLIGFAGRVTADKGIVELLDAVAAVRARGTAVQLAVVGEDEGISDLPARTRRLLREPWVLLHGHVPDATEHIAAFDVLCLPSHREGLPTVVLEAMAAGVPVVASAATGVVDLVEHERTGLLVPVGDSDRLAAALERVLHDAPLRQHLVSGAAESVQAFSEGRVWRRHRVHYRAVMRAVRSTRARH
ncbi:glycosyltransferase [Curtobacterium sp. BRD11]|uniref:glycosyltransferase n=1 Tax=Curtobacterium sp. BRD11 TaxID=2962581 RepID=UPI002882753E|nr:glycosyltransferase [Curtobacterium sp. BRD11]MDT0209473.1 glycosyltransferase [Curtobacterium sp. BRD11]